MRIEVAIHFKNYKVTKVTHNFSTFSVIEIFFSLLLFFMSDPLKRYHKNE